VNAAHNAETDVGVLARHGAVAIYAATGDESVTVPIRPMMMLGGQWHFVLLYTLPVAAKAAAIEDVRAAVAAGAVRVGDEVGLPLHRFPLEQTGAAHAAVADGAVGKVLITIEG
jgi:NADPH2:quinone reductase